MNSLKIQEALSLAQSKIKNIELNASVQVKTLSGGSYTFRYATLGQIKDVIRPVLEQYGLSIVQSVENNNMITAICHGSGERIESKLPLPELTKTTKEGVVIPMTPQEIGSVITYFRRYGLVTALNLVAEDDDDANVAQGNGFKKKENTNAIEEEKELSDGIKLKAFISPKTGKQLYAWQKGEEKGYLSGYEYDMSVSNNKLMKQ